MVMESVFIPNSIFYCQIIEIYDSKILKQISKQFKVKSDKKCFDFFVYWDVVLVYRVKEILYFELQYIANSGIILDV